MEKGEQEQQKPEPTKSSRRRSRLAGTVGAAAAATAVTAALLGGGGSGQAHPKKPVEIAQPQTPQSPNMSQPDTSPPEASAPDPEDTESTPPTEPNLCKNPKLNAAVKKILGSTVTCESDNSTNFPVNAHWVKPGADLSNGKGQVYITVYNDSNTTLTSFGDLQKDHPDGRTVVDGHPAVYIPGAEHTGNNLYVNKSDITPADDGIVDVNLDSAQKRSQALNLALLTLEQLPRN